MGSIILKYWRIFIFLCTDIELFYVFFIALAKYFLTVFFSVESINQLSVLPNGGFIFHWFLLMGASTSLNNMDESKSNTAATHREFYDLQIPWHQPAMGIVFWRTSSNHHLQRKSRHRSVTSYATFHAMVFKLRELKDNKEILSLHFSLSNDKDRGEWC